MTLDHEVTLTFDLHKIQLHVMNAHTVKHIYIRYGKVVMHGLRDTAADGRREGRRGMDKQTDGRMDGRLTDLGNLCIVFPV